MLREEEPKMFLQCETSEHKKARTKHIGTQGLHASSVLERTASHPPRARHVRRRRRAPWTGDVRGTTQLRPAQDATREGEMCDDISGRSATNPVDFEG